MIVEEATGDGIEGALEGEPWRMGSTMVWGEPSKFEVTENSNSPSDGSPREVQAWASRRLDVGHTRSGGDRV